MNINMPKEVNSLIHALEHNGHKAYAVGGCVRDSLLNKEPHDWDLCTSATPEEMLSILNRGTKLINGSSTFIVDNAILTGEKYGTITFVVNGEAYEITTFRKETGYSDNRHPDKVEYTKAIEEDLSRRDFTINAMAYNDEEGLIDPFGGLDDLENGRIRCVGNPEDRFNEDALRILRAIRFATKYCFHIEENTSKSIKKLSKNLDTISKERLRDELCKMIVNPYFPITITSYKDVLAEFIPEFKDSFGFDQHTPYHSYDVFEHTVQALHYNEHFNCKSDLITRLTILFHDIGKPACATWDEENPEIMHFYGHGEKSAEITDEIMRRLKFDNETRKAVVELVKYHDTSFEDTEKSIRRWLNKIGPEQFQRMIEVKIADINAQDLSYLPERLDKIQNVQKLFEKMKEKEQCFKLKDLAINGKDLIEIGYKPGKQLGNMLNKLLEKVIDGDVKNEKTSLMYIAKKNLEKEIER